MMPHPLEFDNEGTLGGVVTRDPVWRRTPARPPDPGLVFCEFTMQHTDKYTSETSYWAVICWGELAERTDRKLSKARAVRVTFRLSQQDWGGAKTKAKRHATRLVATRIELLDN